MVRSAPKHNSSLINHSIDRILSTGLISRQEHLQLASALLADTTMTDEERARINRVFDYLQVGRLKVVD